jgi:alpha-1,2-mannosyltransferase
VRATPTSVALGLLTAIQLGLIVAVTNRVHPIRPILPLQLAGFAALAVTLAVLWANGRGSEPLGQARLRAVLFGGALLLQLAALLSGPVSSDDDYRYAWDAKVQLAGVDPYRYPPDASALAHLQDQFLFPHQQPCRHHPIPGGCTNINRPAGRTIYPPAAQAGFDLIRLASLGGRGNQLPLQLAGALGVLGATALLLRWRSHIGEPSWPVAAWALNPSVAVELTNNAHIEWLAVIFALASLIASRAGRRGWAGAFIGAAIATKLYPGVLLVTAGRRPARTVSAAIAVVAVSYLPHVIAVGTSVIGYLPRYLHEESYSNGGRYIIVTWLAPMNIAQVLAPLLLIIALAWIWWHADPLRPDLAAVTAVGVYLLITTPNYPWYAMLLVAMIAASGRLQWLWLSFSPTLLYLATTTGLDPHTAGGLGYGIALAVTLSVATRRWLIRARPFNSRDSSHSGGTCVTSSSGSRSTM